MQEPQYQNGQGYNPPSAPQPTPDPSVQYSDSGAQHIPVRQVPPTQNPYYSQPIAPVAQPQPMQDHSYDPAFTARPQPVSQGFTPDIAPPQYSAPPAQTYSPTPLQQVSQAPAQPEPKPRFSSKLKMFAGVGALVAVLIVLVAVDLRPKGHSGKVNANNASPVARSTYQDSGSGLLVSYPSSWKFTSNNTAKDGPGKAIYLGPHDIGANPAEVRQQYLNDPQLAFYIYDSKPTPKGNSVLNAPVNKLTDLYIVAGANDYVVKSSLTTGGETIMLSACPDKYCILQVNGKYIVPELTTYSSAAGVSGHGKINTTSADYQTAIRIWQSLRY